MSDSVQPHRQQPTRLRHPWDSPGKNTGVGCHFLLQCMEVKSEGEVSVMSDSATPWTAAYQAPLSMGFSRQEYWSGVPLPSPNGFIFNTKYMIYVTMALKEAGMLNKLIVIKHNLKIGCWLHQESALFHLLYESFVTFFDLSYCLN